jgi:hypothetical protein
MTARHRKGIGSGNPLRKSSGTASLASLTAALSWWPAAQRLHGRAIYVSITTEIVLRDSLTPSI